jgi:RNA 2',3'-cyclic 3'-phosphodiesterase
VTTEPRLFVAVPLDDPARAAVTAIVERVRQDEGEGRPVRWVRLDGIHLTLRFLGPTAADRIAELSAAIQAAAKGVPPFEITIGGAGAFPTQARPRTLWLGLRDGVDRLAAVAGRVDDALAGAGWPRETRPFKAHLTLARSDGVRSGPRTVASLKSAAGDETIPSLVDRLVLFESVTGRGPAEYVPRAEARLG